MLSAQRAVWKQPNSCELIAAGQLLLFLAEHLSSQVHGFMMQIPSLHSA
jgi:hypothetical protein